MVCLITGVAGFIGSHLAERLINDGHKVIGVDNFSTGLESNVKLLNTLTGSFNFTECDILSQEFESVFKAIGRFDCIFHQAALGSVPRSIENPEATFESNVIGFQNVLKLAKTYEAKKIVFASSSSIYGIDGVVQSPYAASKKINEVQAQAWSEVFDIPIIGLRYFNVFGPRQNPNGPYAAVIPKWIQAIKTGEEIEIHGDGNQSRDFTYVKNVVNANILAMQSDIKNEVFDIGAGRSTSLNELVELLRRSVFRRDNIKIKYIDARKGDVKKSMANILPACTHLRYEPCDLETGLQEMRCHLGLE